MQCETTANGAYGYYVTTSKKKNRGFGYEQAVCFQPASKLSGAEFGFLLGGRGWGREQKPKPRARELARRLYVSVVISLYPDIHFAARIRKDSIAYAKDCNKCCMTII